MKLRVTHFHVKINKKILKKHKYQIHPLKTIWLNEVEVLNKTIQDYHKEDKYLKNLIKLCKIWTSPNNLKRIKIIA